MKVKDIIFQIENLDFEKALKYLVKNAGKNGHRPGGPQARRGKAFVVTINPEIVMLANADSEYEKVIKSADLALCDGIGIVWAGKIFGKGFTERIHGIDLVERLCETAAYLPAGRQVTVGFVGGRENVAQHASECLRKKYPGLKVAFAVEEWQDFARGPVARFLPGSAHSRLTDSALPGDPSTRTTPRSSHQPSAISHQPKCDILFVAFGSPKQEVWIYKHLHQIDTKVAIGVGGAFDFIAGIVPRAPVWVRKIGLEWLFRLIIQPWRAKRQLALPKFVFLVLKERFL